MTGWDASPTDRTTWGSHAAALAMVTAQQADGIGYVLTEDTPELCVDLDHCIAADGTVEAWAMEIVEALNSYTEISPSGTGLHIWARASVPGSRNRTGQIEMYDRDRYMTVTGRPLPGYDRPIRDAQAQIEALYARVFVQPEHAAPAAPVALTLDDHETVDRLHRERDGKAARLLDGDTSGYPSPSEARAALAWKCCFYTDDVEQVERIVRASGLFKAADSDRERDRKARNDAAHAVATYAGPRYRPEHGRAPRLTIVPNANDDALSCADVRKELAAAQAIIAQKDEQIAHLQARVQEADAKLERLSFERSQSMQVLRAPDLNPGQKLTHFAQVIDLGARIANGEQQPEAGFRSPAIRVAEMTGQKVQAVRRHRKEMAERGIIQKVNVRERTEAEGIDPETGEILTATGMREVTHIRVPDNNIINLIRPAVAYERPEDAPKRGGNRVKCQHHPDAGTVTKWRTECAECHVVLEQGETYHEPDPMDTESSHIKLEPEPSVVNTVHRGHISEPELSHTNAAPEPVESSHTNFAPETLPLVVPPDFWDDPGPDASAWAAFYRGESA